VAARAERPVTVDGVLDETVWQHAEPVPLWVPTAVSAPVSPTKARLAWDDTFLYVAYELDDRDLYATHQARDSMLWEQDVVELLFVPGDRGQPYYEFEFSPKGTVYDSLTGHREAGSWRRWARWDCDGLEVAVTTRGTLNHWQDRDEGYTVEAAIPFASLPTLAGAAPQAGDTWFFTVARYDYSVHLPAGSELSCSAPISKPSFHQYETWRKMIFVADER
jgi:hypothetical protein